MSLKIIKSSEAMLVEHINLCIYSPPGLGKTTPRIHVQSPLLLDCDKGAYRAHNRKDAVPVASWGDIEGISGDDLQPYDTVIVDTAGRALDYLTADIIAKNPKMGRGGHHPPRIGNSRPSSRHRSACFDLWQGSHAGGAHVRRT